MDPSLQSVRVFLAKPHVVEHKAALRDQGRGLRHVPVDADRRLNGAIYVKKVPPKTPDWVDFLDPLFKSSPLATLKNSGTSAVLLVTVEKRLFALTFGYGRHLLEPEQFIRDYGLRVTLNAVDASKLRSVEVTSHEELTLQTRRQASRATTLPTFGIDRWRDFLRGVTGEPRDTSFATRLSGSEGLTLTCVLSVHDVPGKLKGTLALYEGTTYQAHFGWIDALKLVREQSAIDSLDKHVLKAIQDFDPNEIGLLYMAPPESHDWNDTEHFRFSTEPDTALHDELDLRAYLPSITTRRHKQPLTVKDLHKDNVVVSFGGSGAKLPKWSVYDCLIYEVSHEGKRFVLSGGGWFEVAPTLSKEISDRVAALKISTLAFPRCGANEDEDVYNARARKTLAAKHGFQVSLLDRKTLVPDGALSGLEVCDLMTERGEFIHVKRRTKSATLSHLFAQGVAAAQTFLRDPGFRDRVRALPTLDPKVGALFTPGPQRPDARGYEVVYAVVARGFARAERSLPFLSQISLCHALDSLEDLGFHVSIAKVDSL